MPNCWQRMAPTRVFTACSSATTRPEQAHVHTGTPLVSPDTGEYAVNAVEPGFLHTGAVTPQALSSWHPAQHTLAGAGDRGGQYHSRRYRQNPACDLAG